MSKRSSRDSQIAFLNSKIAWFVLVLGLFIFCFLGVLGAELIVRYRESHRTLPPDYFPTIYYPHTRMRSGLIPNIDYFGWFKINSLGFRNREFVPQKREGVFRIVCLGGSTTFDIGSVGTERPWPEVLERELNQKFPDRQIEVINAGVGGYTSLDSLINFQLRIIPYKPDLVIFYHAHNDLNYALLSIHRQKGLGTNRFYPFEQKPRTRIGRWLSYNSILYAKGLGKIRLSVTPVIKRLLFHLKTPYVPHDWLEQLRVKAFEFKSHLNSFLAIAKVNGIEVVLPEVVIAYRDKMSLQEIAVESDGIRQTYGGKSPEDIQTAYAIYNGIIVELAAHYSKDFVKTSEFVPGGSRYFHDSMHFNGSGSQLMGQGLAQFISRKLQ